MYKSEEHIYFIINKLSRLIKDILISHIGEKELFQKTYVTCHEFAFYCLGECLELEDASKKRLIKDLIRAFTSSDFFSSTESESTYSREYLELIISREFDEMKKEMDEYMRVHGFNKEQTLRHLLVRLGIGEGKSHEIATKILHALQTLELPEPNGYYPSSESIKFAVN